ncbi:MAG: YciI family protein [Fulvivirga sp.]|uniref:YciI family protein n=1 Tax=Fulvivirga sp. TaxID=1931237 RepID=UPI0032EDA8BA
MKNDNLTNEESQVFEKLKADIKAPEHLKSKVTDRLIQLELIKNETNMKQIHIYWAAATVTALVCGLFIGTTFTNSSVPPTSMNQYALFLYENESFAPNNMSNLVEEYTNWAIAMSDQGKLSGAEKLADNGKWLGNQSTRNSNSALSGYFIILANDFEAALAIANKHPHVRYGGGVEVRPIEKLN